MKKVLALVMVLSMAGFASAALQIDVAGGKAVVNGQLDADQYLILTAGNGASLSNFALGASAPSMSGPFMSAAEFEALGVGYAAPAGFAGEAYVMASAPGEAYKNGAQLMADLALATSQEVGQFLRTEKVFEGAPLPGQWKVRTWSELIEVANGALSLSMFSEITGQTALLGDRSIQDRSVIGETYADGEWVPEPMTLSLLGLGALVLRRRS